MTCALCDGSCAGADLTPLLDQRLTWLWTRLADMGDKRGDGDLTAGIVTVTAPQDVTQRAAATGLLGGTPLRAAQTRRVELAALTGKVRVRGERLTPGAVAAHATGRQLAVRAREKAARADMTERLRARLEEVTGSLPAHVQQLTPPDLTWPRLQQSGWVARLLKHADPAGLLEEATVVLAALPEHGRRADRRTLVAGRPHALDDGEPLAGLVHALTGVSGRRPRHAWDELGVDLDNLTGGLLAVGVYPQGWRLPAGSVVTLPPRELADLTWPTPPEPGAWVFVTENPSVLAAAADMTHQPHDAHVRMLCTFGTPSAVETAAVGRLSDAGWEIAVRADFDPSGLAHVRMLLAAAPAATPWRMHAADYLASRPGCSEGLTVDPGETPWDAGLADVMSQAGARAYEEDLLTELLLDLRQGHPPGLAEANSSGVS